MAYTHVSKTCVGRHRGSTPLIGTEPDYQLDARNGPYPSGFEAMLADLPYSAEDAAHYITGASAYPSPNLVLGHMLDALDVGRRAGIIHYMLPKQPKHTKLIAVVAVYCGFNNRGRTYSVFEKK